MSNHSSPIQMVDLKGQYENIKREIDEAILECIASCKFINGPSVSLFEDALGAYLDTKHVIGCGNGTDALQMALMALNLERGDEVVVPAFTYVATAEVIALLGLVPIMVDVNPDTFNAVADAISKAIGPRTKAIVPVHLFGQSCDMGSIMEIAQKHKLYVIEDNAQAIGADYRFNIDGVTKKTGTIGHIGCTSFFPSKNLGCFGDGGALFTDSDELAARIRMIGNHGQKEKYYHSVIGVNSRLDTIQAAILRVKLKYLDDFCRARVEVAERYDAAFSGIEGVSIPSREKNSTHVFHQYTLRVRDRSRDSLKAHLESKQIPSMIYYPVPLYKQDAFRSFAPDDFMLPATEELCSSVISLPIHTEMDESSQSYIIKNVCEFFDNTAHGGPMG
jgi:UDP-2-acetamido-2-deoxy-ribo-hexuluronate aminotransferase